MRFFIEDNLYGGEQEVDSREWATHILSTYTREEADENCRGIYRMATEILQDWEDRSEA